ncbi:MAG: GntR family transcriptional regulator [Pseudooceanicola sp.]|nr:GntR family transcriptional regulator [Pseudooceanicola sp.]
MPLADDQKTTLREDGTPYYVQLAAILRRQISDGTWTVGDRLPTLKDLVAQYGVSPMTVRHALGGLEGEGLIRAERGRGTFVTGTPGGGGAIPYKLTNTPPARGSLLSFRVVETRPANGELRISPDEGIAAPEYVYMKRIFARNGGPFISGQYFVSREAYETVGKAVWPRELISNIMYDTKALGLAKVRQTFRVIASTPQEAAELDIRTHDPLVQVRRFFQTAKGEVICLAQLLYRTDGVVFDINIDLDDRNRLIELAGFPES